MSFSSLDKIRFTLKCFAELGLWENLESCFYWSIKEYDEAVNMKWVPYEHPRTSQQDYAKLLLCLSKNICRYRNISEVKDTKSWTHESEVEFGLVVSVLFSCSWVWQEKLCLRCHQPAHTPQLAECKNLLLMLVVPSEQCLYLHILFQSYYNSCVVFCQITHFLLLNILFLKNTHQNPPTHHTVNGTKH